MGFYEIILPSLNSPVKNIFTYHSETTNSPGDLVEVKLKNRTYYGVILSKCPKPTFKTQPVIKTIASNFISKNQLELFEYINEYYFANPVKSINLFLPKKIFKSKKDISELLQYEKSETKIPSKFNFEKQLNDSQSKVIKDIKSKAKEIHLIHGITGSGKTEIYLRLAAESLQKGKQILILIPEISLTPQNTQYFQGFFGKVLVEVYHSKLNVTEQFKIWKKVNSAEPVVVIGSRSSLFLPYKNLDLIVMDEEHDFAYKQDQNPRYHTRTILQWLNHKHKIPIIMGSATPTLESFQAGQQNKINYHYIAHRSTHTPLPTIEVADMRDEIKKGGSHLISEKLAESINKCLEKNEQVLLLHNKRGYAHYLMCEDCGTVVNCPQCSISLTLHKVAAKNYLQCHYCNIKEPANYECKNCGNISVKEIGSGIQKILEELHTFFPTAKIIRVDSDTTGGKNAHHEMYETMQQNEADIILGTQMISIGIDIPNIQLVGVTNADIALHMPDFRASERSFQLLTQVSGRAGRADRQGKVIIQTFNPDHPVIAATAHNNLHEFYDQEINERQSFGYPPFSKLTKLTFSDENQNTVQKEISRVERMLKSGNIEFKSAPALIEKKHNKYYHHILIKHLHPEKIIPHLKLSQAWWIDRDPVSTA